MRSNPVKQAIKKHGSAHAAYLAMRGKVEAGGGLTAVEWDWFNARMKEWEPEKHEARRKEGHRRYCLNIARDLSTDDLEAILAERRLALQPAGETDAE
jgi:hypothetical protein